jgi:hypothetical protein
MPDAPSPVANAVKGVLNALNPAAGVADYIVDTFTGHLHDDRALGQAKPQAVAPGAADIAKLHAAGFSDQEVADYQRRTTQKLLDAGFSVQDVEAHWGVTDPHSPEVSSYVANNVRQSGVTEAHGPLAAFEAGWGTSVAGIATHMARGEDPNKAFQVQPGHGLLNNLAMAAGQTAGDIGTDVLGFFGGAAAGAAVPGVGETGASEVVGAVAGAAGMGIASQGTREVLLDSYNRGQIHSVSDFLHVVGASTIRTLKSGAENAPFGLAGPIAGKLAEVGAKPVAATVGGIGGATVAGVGTGAAINQRMPDAQDFVTAAATMLIAHGASKAGIVVHGVFRPSPETLHVANNLEEIYRRNGTAPWDAVNKAREDAGLRQELLQQDVNGNAVAPRTHAIAPPEPPPIKIGGEEEPRPGMKNVTPGHMAHSPVVTSFEDLSTALEGSRDDSVSPKGAIGKHQIMVGTARQYGFGEGMSQAELAQWLHDPNNNAMVFHKIAADLHARFHGDMNAMLIAYNAGPGRAGKYLTKGPGTMLEAIPDKTARGGIRYESVPSARDESWLPMETQKYLANGRRRSGGATESSGETQMAGGEGGNNLPVLRVFPSEENHADEGAGGPPAPPGGGEPPTLEGEEGPEGEPKKTYTPEEAIDEIMANIGEPPKPPSLLNPQKILQQYVSELQPAYNIDSRLVEEGEIDRNTDVGQRDMFRQTYASDTRAGAFMRYGVLRIENNAIEVVKDSPSIEKAVDEVRESGGDMQGWLAYMLSKRTVDKDKQGIKTGFNLDAAKVLAESVGEQKKYEKATQTFNKVLNGGLEYGRDSGLFSQGQIDAMMRDNPAYISMRRVMGDDEAFGGGAGGKFNTRDPLRQMEGSDRQIIDPVRATLDNLRVIVAMADRNRAIGSIIGQVERGMLPDLGLKQLEFNPKFTVSAKEGDPFKPYGLDEDSTPEETYKPLLAERAFGKLKPNEFIYYRNGVPERWQANDPALAALMRRTTNAGEANIIGKALDRIAALDRAGVVLDPSFPTRITLRHQITAYIASPLHPPPFLTWMSGISDVLTQNGVFQSWLANGGAGTALADMDVKWFQRDMEKTFEEEGIYNRLWNTVKHPLEAYQWVAERMDAAARVGAYKKGLDMGLSPLKSATLSREAYLDYAEKASLQAVNSIARKVPFFRPKILGVKQFAEAFANDPKGFAKFGLKGTLGLTVATVTIPTMLLYAANYYYDKYLPEDQRFDSIPRWIRDTHYITPPIAGARIQFPYPPVVGTIFGGLVNRFLDFWKKDDPHAFDDWASGLFGEYKPQEMMPTAIKTPLESIANYNFMTGHPIVPSSVEAADGYMQYTNATTEPAKAISRWLGPPGINVANVSPIQLEHWVDGWTGPVGMGILKAVNGRMTDYKPPHQMADTPIVGTFFVRNPDMHAQQIEDFYTDLKSMEAAHTDFALALKHGDQGEIATATKGPFYGLRIVGKIAAALKVQSAAISAVNTDTTMRPEEKSQAVDQILNSMIQLSVTGSGIVAQIQGKKPSEAFQKLDQGGAIQTATAVAQQ